MPKKLDLSTCVLFPLFFDHVAFFFPYSQIAQNKEFHEKSRNSQIAPYSQIAQNKETLKFLCFLKSLTFSQIALNKHSRNSQIADTFSNRGHILKSRTYFQGQ